MKILSNSVHTTLLTSNTVLISSKMSSPVVKITVVNQEVLLQCQNYGLLSYILNCTLSVIDKAISSTIFLTFISPTIWANIKKLFLLFPLRQNRVLSYWLTTEKVH